MTGKGQQLPDQVRSSLGCIASRLELRELLRLIAQILRDQLQITD
jgi:hypothetical protein